MQNTANTAVAPRLTEHHAAMLRSSAVADAVRDARGYASVRDPDAAILLRQLGIPAWARSSDEAFPGLLIPLYRATGEQISWQYRPDASPPDPGKPGKYRKYASQAGRASVIDVHPFSAGRIGDPSVQLFITEGVKKADALTSLGLCAVAISGVFNWRNYLTTLGDWEDIPLKGRHVIIVYDSDARDKDGVLAAMIRLGRWLKSKGAARVSYVITPLIGGLDKTGADDFLAGGGTLEQLWAAGSDEPPAAEQGAGLDPEGLMVDDLAAEALDGRWLWSPGLGWLRYEPGTGRWKPSGIDKDTGIIEAVRQWLLGKYTDAAAALAAAARDGAPGSELKRLEHQAALWRAALAAARITRLAALARGPMTKDATEFDTHQDLVNTPSGVGDLRTMRRLDHDPGYLFTQVTRADWRPGAVHPDWDKALQAIPDDVRDYLQLRYGQALTGHPPPDDVVLVQLGDGENGKTTIVFGCQGALGDYCRLISDRAINRDKSAHPTELMEFRGVRLAVMEELAEERHLDTHRIKQITAPQISARYCGTDSITYDITHALVISTNYDPVVTATDHGSWRRLMGLRFPYLYCKPGKMPAEPGPLDRPAEMGLRERMKAGDDGRAEAVLAWLAEGARRWYEGEPGVREPMTFGREPARVERDTEKWKASANPVFGWVLENLARDPGSHVPSGELIQAMMTDMVTASHTRMSDQTATTRLDAAFGELGWRAAKVKINDKVKRTVRSRRAGSGYVVATASYKAWEGVRYQTAEDDGEDLGSASSASSGDFSKKTSSRTLPGQAEPAEPQGQRPAGTTSSQPPVPEQAPIPVVHPVPVPVQLPVQFPVQFPAPVPAPVPAPAPYIDHPPPPVPVATPPALAPVLQPTAGCAYCRPADGYVCFPCRRAAGAP